MSRSDLVWRCLQALDKYKASWANVWVARLIRRILTTENKGKGAAEPLVGGTFGKYEISGLLGQGGMGEVYETYDTDQGITVALILTDQCAQDETCRARVPRVGSDAEEDEVAA